MLGSRYNSWTLRCRVVLYVARLIGGGVLVAVPDEGLRLVSVSREHGPGLLDAVGALLATAGSLLLLWGLWARRRVLASRSGTAPFQLAVFTLGIGLGLLVASVFSELNCGG